MAQGERAHRICARLLRAHASPAFTSIHRATPTLASGVSQLPAYQVFQRRSYASRRPAPRAPAPGGPPPSGFPGAEDISPELFEAVMARRKGSFASLTAAQYHQVALRFSDAIKKGAQPYSVKLSGEPPVSADILHQVACILSSIRLKSAAALCVAMWASASDLGSRAATLSLAHQLMGSGNWGKVVYLKKIETRFGKLVSEAKDPDALAIEGGHLCRLGKYTASIKMLQRALEAGGPDGFDRRPQVYANLARAFIKLKMPAEALEMLTSLEAEEFSCPDLELGELIATIDPDMASRYMYTAAVQGGRPELFSKLAEFEVLKEEVATDDKVKKEHRLWAAEWSRLADPQARS